MHRLISSLVLLASIAAAQTAGPPSANQQTPSDSGAAPPVLAPGVVIPAELSKSLDAKKNKVGDKVEAKTSVDLLAHGQIVLARNTKIVGHVTEVKARSKDSQNSEVAIAFDRIRFKDGRDLPIQVTVQAIGRPLQNLVEHEPISENPGAMIAVSPPGADGSMGGPVNPRNAGGPQSPYPPGSRSTEPAPNMSGSPMGAATVAPLGTTSEGAVGMKGISLSSSGTTATISSNTQNVHVDGGSQLILKTQ